MFYVSNRILLIKSNFV